MARIHSSAVAYEMATPAPSEKRTIDVPGIVLTEAPCTRTRSPSPKQIVLLNPTSVTYPTPRSRLIGASVRTLIVVVLLTIALWHLYVNFDVAGVVHTHPAAMQF